MVLQMVFSVIIAAALIYLLWLLRGVLLTPVHRGKNQKMIIALKVSGESPDLEQTVDGLLWLMSNGTLTGKILIIDDGMDNDTAAVAERLASDGHRIELKRREEKHGSRCRQYPDSGHCKSCYLSE